MASLGISGYSAGSVAVAVSGAGVGAGAGWRSARGTGSVEGWEGWGSGAFVVSGAGFLGGLDSSERVFFWRLLGKHIQSVPCGNVNDGGIR